MLSDAQQNSVVAILLFELMPQTFREVNRAPFSAIALWILERGNRRDILFLIITIVRSSSPGEKSERAVCNSQPVEGLSGNWDETEG